MLIRTRHPHDHQRPCLFCVQGAAACKSRQPVTCSAQQANRPPRDFSKTLTRYQWDDDGNLTCLTRPDEHQITAEYNEYGQPTLIRQPDGTLWHHAYDTAGNRVATLDPAGNRTRITYDTAGAVASVTDALGNTTQLRSNTAGLEVQFSDPVGSTTTAERDAFGRVITVTNPMGAISRATWNTEGKILSHTDPLGSTQHFSYDAEGNLDSHTDQIKGVTSYTYGPFDLPDSCTTADGRTYRFTRDTELQLAAVTDPLGHTWTYTYDPAGRLISECDYDGRTTTHTLDAAGQVLATTNPAGQVSTSTYDQLGRVVLSETAEGSNTYAYDAGGRTIRATSPGVDISRTYDVLGELATEHVNGRSLTLQYDAIGNITHRTTPAGQATQWVYRADGLPTALTTSGHTLTFERDAAGRETSRTTDTSVTERQVWDAAGRRIRQTLTTRGGTKVLDRAHRYRPDHYLIQLTDPTGDHRYTLDPLGRITNAITPTGEETYTYDPAGNQTNAQWGREGLEDPASGRRAYAGTLLTRAGNTRYEHDAAGRVTLQQRTRLSRKPDTWHYAWNTRGQLTSTTTPDGTVWTYTYDPFGRRTSKQRLEKDGTTAERIVFTWHDATLVEQTSATGETITWNHDGFAPLTQARTHPGSARTQAEYDTAFHVITTNIVGTPTHLTTSDGHTTSVPARTVWGHASPESLTPLRLPGQYADPETSWHYNLHRHYNPHAARYTSPDPLGLLPGPNSYAYPVNPFTWGDPLGLSAHPYKPLDSLGRATGIDTVLNKNNIGGKTDPKVDPAGWESGKGYNRAHLLGAQLGGSNKDPRNFVTMHQYANTPVMRVIEGRVRKAIEKGNETVQYKVTPIYRGSDLIPLGVTIEATGSGGLSINQTIMNRAK